MGIRHFEMTNEEKEMILEVMEKARTQEYTPQMLCDLQKVIDAQYYYWWINDLKVEERAKHLFTEEFDAACTGVGGYQTTPLGWAKNAKYCNSFVNSLHMGHNPLVWFMDDTHARGIFFFESHFTYLDNPDEKVELFFIYCDDFVKKEDGQWYIDHYRLIQTKSDGEHRAEILQAPDGYEIENWDNI